APGSDSLTCSLEPKPWPETRSLVPGPAWPADSVSRGPVVIGRTVTVVLISRRSTSPSLPTARAVKLSTPPCGGAGTPKDHDLVPPGGPREEGWWRGPFCHRCVWASPHGRAGPFIGTATYTAATAADPGVARPPARTGVAPGLEIAPPEGEVMVVAGGVPFEPPTPRSYRKPSLDPISRLPAESAGELIT